MPAVGVSVFTPDAVLLTGVWGTADVTTDEPVTLEHMWDLASLTKVLVTLPEVLALVDVGSLVLDAPLGAQWPAADGHAIGQATLEQVLSYDAGMPASGDFFRPAFPNRGARAGAVIATPRERPAGSGAVYSDIGAIALGELVPDLTGRSLPELARRRTGLSFTPSSGPFVATEECPWRGRLIKGEVHDENAWALDRIAGHAGAFGRIDQVAEAARHWLRGDVVSTDLHVRATRENSRNEDAERFGLGWWLANTRGLGGQTPGADSWGMSGFVGNRIWMEPSAGYGVVVLSNRVHPVRGDRGPYNEWCDGLLNILAQAVDPRH